MSRRSMIFGAAFSLVALMALGCSLIGRVVNEVAEDATGGALSTIESLQSEMGEALATLPAEVPQQLPNEIPLATEVGEPTGTDGAITGSLSYPSEGIPPLKVVAFDAGSGDPVATLETESGQSTYSLSVPMGAYYVVAYTLDGQLAGGYTLAVLCGLGAECTDHMLIPVGVAPGIGPEDIDPTDWYAPEGSFPAMP